MEICPVKGHFAPQARIFWTLYAFFMKNHRFKDYLFWYLELIFVEKQLREKIRKNVEIRSKSLEKTT